MQTFLLVSKSQKKFQKCFKPKPFMNNIETPVTVTIFALIFVKIINFLHSA
jgi:hypothetical protein